MEAEVAPPGFHARFNAKGKLYRYEIFTGPVLPPWRARKAWHARKPLRLDFLDEAIHCFEGRHNFSAFAANRGYRRVGANRSASHDFRAESSIEGQEIRLEFEGDGFLYKMVRMMTGAIGAGRPG